MAGSNMQSGSLIRIQAECWPADVKAAAKDKASMVRGVTMLHCTSGQKFGVAQPFTPYASQAVVYSVLLVADADEKLSPQNVGAVRASVQSRRCS